MRVIDINKLSFGYAKGKQVFSSVDLHLDQPDGQGHIIAVMGPSGCGKSTFFKLLLGLEKPVSGTIELGQKNMSVSYLPQEPVLFEHLTPMVNARYFSTAKQLKGYFDETVFQELVDTLGMRPVLDGRVKVSELSGGQKQRLALLRGLSIKPGLLLIDEPTTGMDAAVKVQFLMKLREIVLRHRLMALYITHHGNEAQLIADEVLFFPKKDRPIEQLYLGKLEDFISAPPVTEALEVFAYPMANRLSCYIQDGQIRPARDTSATSVFIFPETKHFEFSERNDGIAFNLIASNELYHILELENKDRFIIEKTDQEFRVNGTFFITGELLNYASDMALQGMLKIQRNQVLKMPASTIQ